MSLTSTYTLQSNLLSKDDQVIGCDYICVIVGVGTLAITLGVIFSTLALICMLSGRKTDEAQNETDEEKMELEKSSGDEATQPKIWKIDSYHSIGNEYDARNCMGYTRLLENEERY